MGMDFYGRQPTAAAGEHFRANCWSWRPIQHLVEDLCGDLFTSNELEQFGYNSNAGPLSQAVCTEMANRFDRWMEHNTDGLSLDLGSYVDSDGRLVGERKPGVVSAHQTSDEHLKQWVEFLRHCGGFTIH